MNLLRGSFESIHWNACVHRLDLGLNSHPKEFLGKQSEEKSPPPEDQRRIKPMTVHHALHSMTS